MEEGDHRILVNVVDADGKSIMPALNGKMGVRFGDGDNTAAANLIISINGLKLERYGAYSVEVSVNDRHMGSLPFFVKPFPASAAPGGAARSPPPPDAAPARPRSARAP